MGRKLVIKKIILKSIMALGITMVMFNPYSSKIVYGAEQKNNVVQYTMDKQIQSSLGSVLLTQLDYETSKTLSGVEFKLVDENGKDVKVGLTTNNSGEIAINDLKAGKYSFVEIKALDGYVHDTTPISFTIVGDESEPAQVELFSKKEEKIAISTEPFAIEKETKENGMEQDIPARISTEIKNEIKDEVNHDKNDDETNERTNIKTNGNVKVINTNLLAMKTDNNNKDKIQSGMQETSTVKNVENDKRLNTNSIEYYHYIIAILVSSTAIVALKKFKSK